jgi:hypothetical protein
MKSTKELSPKLDTDRIDDAVLALLYLNLHQCGVAWKGFDWDAMSRLYEKDLISDPVRKAKSVGLSEAGERRAQELFERMFVLKEPAGARAPGRGSAQRALRGWRRMGFTPDPSAERHPSNGKGSTD